MTVIKEFIEDMESWVSDLTVGELRKFTSYIRLKALADKEEKLEDGWIKWEGGECPVDDSAYIEQRFLYNGVEKVTSSYAYEVNDWDIVVAYRIPREAKVEEEVDKCECETPFFDPTKKNYIGESTCRKCGGNFKEEAEEKPKKQTQIEYAQQLLRECRIASDAEMKGYARACDDLSEQLKQDK